MNKKKFTFLTVIVTVLMVLSLSIFVACNEESPSSPTTPEEIKPTEGLIIQNSDFKVVASGEYPKKINDWSSGRTYSSDSYPADVVAGAINLTKTEYDKNKSKWATGDAEKDNALYTKLSEHLDSNKDAVNNILGIYMPEKATDSKLKQGPTAYSFTSPSFNLDKNSYYEIKVDVLTKDLKGNPELKDGKTEQKGANIYISSTTYQEFEQIDTNGEWKTYSIYVETSPVTNASLTLRLSLGNASSSDSTTGLTTGYAFFDNIEVNKLEDSDTLGTAHSQYLGKVAESQKGDKLTRTVKTASLNVPNEYFDFGSGSVSSSSMPFGWEHVVGNSGKDEAPKSGYTYNGIINPFELKTNAAAYGPTIYQKTGEDYQSYDTGLFLTQYDNEKFANNLVSDTDGHYNKTFGNKDSVFMLSQQHMTAQGVKNKNKITIEKMKTYKLSVSLYTFDIFGDGVSLILTSADGKKIEITGISRNYSRTEDVDENGNLALGKGTGKHTDGWVTYDFFIKGNQYRDYNYDLTLWLGTGGTNDNKEIEYTKYSSTSSSGTKETTYTSQGTFSTGWVFFDNVMFSEIESSKYDEITNTTAKVFDTEGATEFSYDAEKDSYKYAQIKVDLNSKNLFEDDHIDTSTLTATTTSDNIPEHTLLNNAMPNGWKVSEKVKDNPAFTNKDNTFIGSIGIGGETSYQPIKFPGKDTYIPGLGEKDDPNVPYEIQSKGALAIDLLQPSTIAAETKTFTIKANKAYRISLWVKTQYVPSTTGIYVSLMEPGKEAKDAPISVVTFDKINTKDVQDNNGWQELTFIVHGNQTEDKNVFLKVSLGTGNRYSLSTLASGTAFVTNMSNTEISYQNFKDTTTNTYVKAKDYTTTPMASTFTNGRFDGYDQLDKDLSTDHKDFVTRVPNNFKASDKRPDTWKAEEGTGTPQIIKDSLRAGIITMNKVENDPYTFEPSNQINTLFPVLKDTYFNKAHENYIYKHDVDTKDERYIGGPNMLAIGYDDGANTATFSYTSDVISLQKETKYAISLWAKTINGAVATIGLSGEAQTASQIVITNTDQYLDTNGWGLYTFYIQTSIFDSSLKLKLSLGDLTKKGDEQKSGGLVLFDSISLKTLDNEFDLDGYNAVEGQEIKIELYKDGFYVDSTSDSALVSSSNWTGAADTNQSKDNTKSGIINVKNVKSSIVEGKKDDEGQPDKTLYVDCLGNADIKKENIEEPSTEELQKKYDAFVKETNYSTTNSSLYKVPTGESEFNKEPFNRTDYATTRTTEDSVKRDLFTLIIDNKFNDLINAKMITEDVLKYNNAPDKIHLGDQFLVINNVKDSAYSYSSPSYTFKAGNYYEISLLVRTYCVATKDKDGNDLKDNGAYVELYLGSASQSDNPFIFNAVKTNTVDNMGEWTELKFYIQVEQKDITNAKLKLGLGKYKSADQKSTLTEGYAFFDNIEIKSITGAEYQLAEANDTTVLKREIKAAQSGDTSKPPETTNNSKQFNLEDLAWMIPTIILAILTIAVVVIFAIKKIKRPKKASQTIEDNDVDRVNDNIIEKKDRYDDNME